MPSQVDWHIPGHVISWKYQGDVSSEDVESGYIQVFDLLKSTENSLIHFLVDFSEAGEVLFELEELAGIPLDMIRDRIGWFVYTGKYTDIYYRALTDALASIRKTKIKWFNTSEEGMAFLKLEDKTIP